MFEVIWLCTPLRNGLTLGAKESCPSQNFELRLSTLSALSALSQDKKSGIVGLYRKARASGTDCSFSFGRRRRVK